MDSLAATEETKMAVRWRFDAAGQGQEGERKREGKVRQGGKIPAAGRSSPSRWQSA